MPELYTEGAISEEQGALDDFSSSMAENWGAGWQRQWDTNPVAFIGRGLRSFNEEWDAQFGDGELVDQATAQDEVKRRGLSLDIPVGGISRYELDSLQYLKQREIAQNSVSARASDVGSIAAGFAGGFAAGAVDPINVASAFIPFVREARYSKWLADAGESVIARALVRAQAGAIEGAAGAAVIEPLVYLGAQREQLEYGLQDSFVNVMFGTALGGGLHVIGGAAYDWKVRRNLSSLDVGLRAAMANVPDAGQMAAINQTANALEAELPSRADEVLISHLPAADKAALAATPVTRASMAPTRDVDVQGLTMDVKPVRESTAVTPAGTKVPVLYAIVPLDQLTASHSPNLDPNPAFPAELQPRDRTRLQSEAQISNMASKLNPELLGEQPQAGEGAPIVDPTGIVESGNGRVIALRRVKEGNPEKWREYQEYLRSKGYDTDGIADPVLVRIRSGEMDADARQAFTREANAPAVAGMSASEQAISDSRALPDAVLAQHAGGDFRNVGNASFVRAVIDALAPSQSERALFLRPDGVLSDEGARRIERAILARAFGDDAKLITDLTEASEESGIKAIGGALVDVAPVWARMRADAENDVIDPSVDSTKNLLEAIRTIRKARNDGQNLSDLVNQVDLLSGTMDPKTQTWVRAMFRNANLTGPLGRDKLGELLEFYAVEARKQISGPSLLGDAVATPEQILDAKRQQDRRRGKQLDLLGGRADRGEAILEPVAQARRDVPEPRSGEAGADVGRDSGGDVVDEQTFKAIGRRFTETQAAWSADQVFAAAAVNQPALNAMGREVTETIPGTKWHEAPPKTRERFNQKLEEKGVKPGQITDVVRGTISATTPDQADAAVAALAQRATILDEDWRRYPGGYVDRKLNVRFEDGQVGEIILASNHMIDVKDEAHRLLERSRGMTGEARDRQRLSDLQEQEQVYFEPAKVKDNGPWEKTYKARASEVGRGGVAPKVLEKPSSVRTDAPAAADSNARSPISDQASDPSLSTNALSASPSRTNAAGVPSQSSQVTDMFGRPSKRNMALAGGEVNDRWSAEADEISAKAQQEVNDAKDPTPEQIAADMVLDDAHLASLRERGLLTEADEAELLAAEELAVQLEHRAAAYEAAATCEMEAA